MPYGATAFPERKFKLLKQGMYYQAVKQATKTLIFGILIKLKSYTAELVKGFMRQRWDVLMV